MMPSTGHRRPLPLDGTDGYATVLTVPRTPGGRLLGAGVDLLDQQRFALAARRVGPAWPHRIFDETERAAEPAELARLFGIKECVIKIVGGLPVGAGYRDIVVATTGGDGARPIRLRGELARWARDHRAVLAGGVLAGGVLEECPDTAGSAQAPPNADRRAPEIPGHGALHPCPSPGLPALDLCWAAATEAEVDW
ncbi:hypothetical protein [Kribbella solani]|uniref:Phosphopantetheinyl transferase (Holo-ACP synthase) n=1 Tax=Kribbella solani TaxID=236067 RepID=A0A841DE80_9ACTN|nr:hypothetical protein [Kribbella solani]MBB5977384.1 phosphopantetheinyl transferase (holo-ACP synthase) [Kribbella solani]